MDQQRFEEAKRFAFTDIRRELALAKASETDAGKAALRTAGLELGGGNFMAALALLCYTEFAGKLRYARKKPNGSDHAAENFNLFFDDLGPGYKAFRVGTNVYDVFRCGLAHEYYAKKSCTIYMFGDPKRLGVGQESTGRYYFVVDRYCTDLERAFEDLEAWLFP